MNCIIGSYILALYVTANFHALYFRYVSEMRLSFSIIARNYWTITQNHHVILSFANATAASAWSSLIASAPQSFPADRVYYWNRPYSSWQRRQATGQRPVWRLLFTRHSDHLCLSVPVSTPRLVTDGVVNSFLEGFPLIISSVLAGYTISPSLFSQIVHEKVDQPT